MSMGSKNIDSNNVVGLEFVNIIELNMNAKTVVDIACVNNNIKKQIMPWLEYL